MAKSLLLLIIYLAVGCAPEDESGNEGKLNLSLTTDYTITSETRVATKGGVEEGPSINDLQIQLYKNEDESIFREWEKLSDFPKELYLPESSYRLKASYGEQHKGAFDKPYYEGNTTFNIVKRQTTRASVVCKIANVKVTINYKEGFKKYFKDYSMKIASTGDSLLFVKDESRAAFFEPSRLGMQLQLTKQNGSTLSFTPPAISDTQGGKHYQLNIDVTEEGAGGASLVISFDKTTEEKPILINLDGSQSIETMPFFTATGFTSGQPISFIEGTDFKSGSIHTLLTARNGIKSCIIKTSSRELQKLGWPETIDLAAPNVNLSALNQLGFSYTTGDKMAELDFSGLASKLPSNSSAPVLYPLYIEARDMNGISSSDFSLLLISLVPGFELFKPDNIKAGTSETPITFELKEGDPEKIKIEYLEYGQWVNCTMLEPVKATNTQNVYTCKVKATPVIDNIKLRLNYNNGARTSNEVLLNADPLIFELVATPENVWARRAYLAIKSSVAGLDLTKFKVKKKGSSVNLNTVVEDNKIIVLGLNAGETQDIVVSLGAAEKECTITTEVSTQIPNSNFDEGTTLLFDKKINKGGKYGYSERLSSQDTKQLQVYDPVAWCTTNSKTVPKYLSKENTWYMVPSVFLTEENGNTFTCIQNVKWDDNINTDPPSKYKLIGGTSLSDLDVPNIDRKSVGKLFLGSYTAPSQAGEKGKDMDEKYTYGIDFPSRPSKLRFKYKYNNTSGAVDGGLVNIDILDKNNDRIGGNSIPNYPLTSKEYTTLELDIDYIYFNKKASKIKLYFASSQYANDSQAAEDKSDFVTIDYKSEAASYGNQLFIGNIELIYE